MLDLGSVLSAEAARIFDYLTKEGRCFSIPPYQREYAWDEEGQLTELFEDLCRGLRLLGTDAERTTFLGTVITIRDEALWQKVAETGGGPNYVPSEVRTVIDGQQRLTTFCLLSIAIHHRLSLLIDANREALPQWLRDRATVSRSAFYRAFAYAQADAAPGFRSVPRITREELDTWSSKEDLCRYESPVGSLISDYVDHVDLKEAGIAFDPGVKLWTKQISGPEELLRVRWKFIDDLLDRWFQNPSQPSSRRKDVPEDLPLLDDLLSWRSLQLNLYSQEIEQETVVAAKADPGIGHLLRLQAFAEYVRTRVTIGAITASKADTAFDMFESLNTTGEPLTALETFRPLVVHNSPHWHDSPEQHVYLALTSWLDSIRSAREKQKTSADVVTTGMLAEFGLKCGSRLNEQRQKLAVGFSQLGSYPDRVKMIETLGDVANFVQKAWGKTPAVSGRDDVLLTPATQFGLRVLFDAKHDVTKAALSRFFAQIRLAQHGEHLDRAISELESAVLGSVAFFGIWRGYYQGTNNIDSIHRAWMQDGGARRMRPKSEDAPRWVESPPLDSSSYLKYVRERLNGAGIDRDSFVRAASENDLFTPNKSLTRLLLLAALHDSKFDPESGRLIAAAPNYAQHLTFDSWGNEEALSIEHVAPQAGGQDKVIGWNSDMYTAERHVHRLGNLMLLPQSANSSVGAGSWAQKRLAYRFLAASTAAEAEAVRAEADAAGLPLKPGIVRLDGYYSLVEAVAQTEGDWDLEQIAGRSENLAGRAWDNLAPWLGL